MRLNGEFAFFPSVAPGRKGHLQLIAEFAIKEYWGPEYFYLEKYIDYNFELACQQNLIKYVDDKYCLYRVGSLVTNTGEPITLMFVKNYQENKQPWVYRFVFKGSRFTVELNGETIQETAPQSPKYQIPPYHADYTLRWNFNHYLSDHESRISSLLPNINNDYQRFLIIYGGVTVAHSIAGASGMVAIPQWHRDKAAQCGSYKWFLPVRLDDEDFLKAPNLIAALDPDDENKEYRVSTILTPEMAYPNARALNQTKMSPISAWLPDDSKRQS